MSRIDPDFYPCYLWLKLVAIAQRHAASRAVDAPTDPAVRLVEDVFKIDEHFRPLTKLERSPHAGQTIARQIREKRHERVVIDDANAIDRGANRQQTILN